MTDYTPPVAVLITDVLPDTVRITCAELRVGDRVHDAVGNRYPLTEVKPLKRQIRTRRRDGWVDYWQPSDTITVATPRPPAPTD